MGDYTETASEAMYDVNHGYQKLIEGDRYGYDYDLWNQDVKLWTGFSIDRDILHSFVTAKMGGRRMWREGFMRNGLFQDNSYGKSGKAHFLDGGLKMGSTINLGKGHAVTVGIGYELRAPNASVAFMCPEMNNDYAQDLDNEKVLTTELGYALATKWFRLNLTGYYYKINDANEWQQFYNDDINSFSYNSLTGVNREYYGVELGLRVQLTTNLNLVALGTYSEAKYIDDTQVNWMSSTTGELHQELCHNKGMRQSGTPLAAASLGLNYRIKRWYLNLAGKCVMRRTFKTRVAIMQESMMCQLKQRVMAALCSMLVLAVSSMWLIIRSASTCSSATSQTAGTLQLAVTSKAEATIA